MNKDNFFSNLRDGDDSDFDFDLPQNRSIPSSKADVVRELSIEKNATNINVTVTLNGEVIVDGDIKEATKNGTADKKEHPGLFNKKGHIAFLGHGSEVRFRNIRIKELK